MGALLDAWTRPRVRFLQSDWSRGPLKSDHPTTMRRYADKMERLLVYDNPLGYDWDRKRTMHHADPMFRCGSCLRANRTYVAPPMVCGGIPREAWGFKWGAPAGHPDYEYERGDREHLCVRCGQSAPYDYYDYYED